MVRLKEKTQARWLTRRLLRADRWSVGARWAALASVWVHLGVLVALALARFPPIRPSDPPPATPIELVVLEPERLVVSDPAAEPDPVLPVDGVPVRGARSTRVARHASPAASTPAEPSAEVAADPVGTEVIGEPSPAPVVAVRDPNEELREALGFAPIDRSRLAPRRELQGAMFQDLGPGCTADAPPAGEPEPTWQSAEAVRGSPLGAYLEQVEATVFARWSSVGLDVHSIAIGIQGDVAIQYTIAANGTVSNIRISRSSGIASLDALAVHAIPPRLPRLPRELGLTELQHEILFRYHNPP